MTSNVTKIHNGLRTYVHTMPPCDLCKDDTPAVVDAKSKWGPWAFMCHDHWRSDAATLTLGVGHGQRLVLREVK